MSKVKATYDGFVGHNGVPVRVRVDDEYDSDHPLVQAQPGLFTEPPARRILSKPKPEVKPRPGAKDADD